MYFDERMIVEHLKHTETISAIHLLVFPLSSFMVIGRSSFILSKAAGQSSYLNKVENCVHQQYR